MKKNVTPVRIDNIRNLDFWVFVKSYVKLSTVVSQVFVKPFEVCKKLK